MHYDVFNGDADGIIALIQMRLHTPKASTLITGVKRDIKLLEQVVAAGDAASVTVLDISMEKNAAALEQLLTIGVEVFYCDHHRSGEIPSSAKLKALIDLDAQVCTSLLISEYLGNPYIHWAITAAFGDNLHAKAQQLVIEHGISEADSAFLKELGTLINYNGYGNSLGDLHIAPRDLYQQLLAFPNPLALRDDPNSVFYQLKAGYDKDYAFVTALEPIQNDSVCRIFELPCEAWARRISGVFGNELANQAPDQAHAVLTLNASKTDYLVSVRAPINNRLGADEICSQFATGGGRKAAAGINALALEQKQQFIQTLHRFYS
ncbi:DHH family phosphoesterase [Alginatibacterium sediminis]|uniref:DHH family phosphoesterase n=1 Tax=Alginatibacterium sediminis TaxID=2164068 RepID=A0A420E607_9ALTE|nr:DHH family phosphoesterase [Alginatibacterium sediminis]RKF13146.1 DHH family phosphoesterase [Alginatibacterium sediminis]